MGSLEMFSLRVKRLHLTCQSSSGAVGTDAAYADALVELIRLSGHVPKGGYDGHDGSRGKQATPAAPAF